MICLHWYLGVGAAVLAIVFGANRLMKERESESIREILDAVNPERKKLSYQILNNSVALALAAVAVVVWPIAIHMKGTEVFSKQRASAMQEEREFAVERAHLHEPLTVPQIEAREAVEDPLGAVPNMPFGHLNAAWKLFIEGVAADEELWSLVGDNYLGQDS